MQHIVVFIIALDSTTTTTTTTTTTALLLHYYYGTTVRLIKVCSMKPCTASRDQQLYDVCIRTTAAVA